MADPNRPTSFDSGNPVTPAPANTQPPAAPVINETPSDSSAVPVLGQPTARPPIPAGTEVNPDPNAVPGSVQPHHSMLASIFQDLAGGQKTTWRQTEEGPVPVKENLKPAEMARGILAAALTGLASGYTTRGGPGGNKGQAFAAGFKGEQERTDKQASQAKAQAQEEFQNKNVADEMTIRRAVNARDQQRSIDLAQEHAMHMEQAKQSLEQGKLEFAERSIEFHQRQADRMNLLSQLGAKPLTYPDGKPVEEFNSPEEAAVWANKNAALAIQPGSYQTVFEVDPNTNRYMILQKPKGWDDPQWIGVKTDKNGQPIKNSQGDSIPDGTFRDVNGRVAVPAGPMTPHQMYDSQVRLIDLQTKEVSRLEALERLRGMKREREKDLQQQRADDEFNRAQGNPDAIDPKSHNFIVSPSSRTILQQRFIKEAAMQASLLNAVQKEMDRVGVPTASSTTEEKRQFIEMQQQATESRQNLHQLQVNMGLLGRTPNIADVTANNIRTANTKDDGSYDQKTAMNELEGLQVNSGLKQEIRKRLAADLPNRQPEDLDRALTQLEKLPRDQWEYQIGQQKVSQHDKQYMLSKVRDGSGSASSGDSDLAKTEPENTVFRTADGGTQFIPNNAADSFEKRNPQYKRVGRGTKTAEPDTQFGSR